MELEALLQEEQKNMFSECKVIKQQIWSEARGHYCDMSDVL